MASIDYPVSLIRALRDCGPYEARMFVSRLIWASRLIAAANPGTTYVPARKGCKYTQGVHKTSLATKKGGCLLGEAIIATFQELVPALQLLDEQGNYGITELVEQVFPIDVTGLSTRAGGHIEADLRWLSTLQAAEAAGYSWLHAVNHSDAVTITKENVTCDSLAGSNSC